MALGFSGIAAGAASEAFDAAQQQRLDRRLAETELGFRRRGLELQERRAEQEETRFEAAQAQQRREQADALTAQYAKTAANLNQAISDAQAAGNTEEVVRLEGLRDNMRQRTEILMTGLGVDPARIDSELDTAEATATTAEQEAVRQGRSELMAFEAGGEELERRRAAAGRLTPTELEQRAFAETRGRERAEAEFAEGGGPFAGTGMAAQSFNIILDYNQKVAGGQPTTPEEDRTYALAVSNYEQPRTTQGPRGELISITPELPAGFVRPGVRGQPAPAAQVTEAVEEGPEGAGGMRVETITGPKPVTTNEAGRKALVRSGQRAAEQVRDAIVRPDGSIDYVNVINMQNIPLIGLEGVPFTEGRGLRSLFRDALAAITRLETGAQLNEQELVEIQARFLPSPLDTPATIRQKFDRLDQFFSDGLDAVEPELAQSKRAEFVSDVQEASQALNMPVEQVIENYARTEGLNAGQLMDAYRIGVRGQGGG